MMCKRRKESFIDVEIISEMTSNNLHVIWNLQWKTYFLSENLKPIRFIMKLINKTWCWLAESHNLALDLYGLITECCSVACNLNHTPPGHNTIIVRTILNTQISGQWRLLMLLMNHCLMSLSEGNLLSRANFLRHNNQFLLKLFYYLKIAWSFTPLNECIFPISSDKAWRLA